MKEDQSNKKKGWFDFLRPLRSALSRSEFNALFDQRNYYSRELEDIANQGAKTLVDEWALETSKKASKQLQGDVTLPDFRFLPDVYWDNGAFSYNVDGKEVKDDKKTQVSRLKELSDHYDLPLPDKAEEVVSRDSFEKILGHYYKDDKGNVFKPEPSGDLRLNLNNLHLLPEDSNKAYSNITMEDFSKLKLVSMSDKEVNDFKERSRKAVDGSNILKQTIEDIRTYLNGEQYLGSVGFEGRVPASTGLSFRTSDSPLSFPVDSYHAKGDYTISLLSHKAMQNGEPVHLDIDKYNAWQYSSILSKLDDYILESSNKDIKEMNKVADHLAELTKDKEKKFPTRDTNGNLAFDASNITKNGDISFYVHDEYGESRLAKAFIITGNRSVECAIYDNRLISLGEEGRRNVLDAMKFKERELEIDLKHKKEQVLTAAEEYAQLKKYDHQYFKLPSGEVYYAEASADNKIGHGILSLYELKLPMGDRDEKPSVYGVDTFGKTVFRQMNEQEVNEFHQLIEKNKEDLANEEKNAESKVTLRSTTESPESTSQTQDKDGKSVQSGYTTDLPLPDREVADDAVLERRGWQDPQDVEEVSGRWHTQAMKEADAYRAYSRLLIAKMSLQENNDSMPWVSKTTGIPKSIEGKPYEGISGLMLAMNTEKEGYDLPIYLDKEDASSMQLKLDPFAVTFPVIGKDGKVTELYNIDQTDFREQHPRQYEQFSHDNSAEIRIKENEAISLNTLATNGLWYVPVKEDGKENLAVYSLADKAIHIAPMEDYRENRDNYYRDLTIAMVSSTRLNNTNSGFKRYLKEDLISHLGSAMLSQKYRFSFNANNPDVSHFWKEMIRNNANTAKSFLQAAEASASRVYSRVEEVAKSDNREESDSLDLQTTTPGTGDEDGDGIADDQENYAPEKKKVSNSSEESSKIREVHHFKR